MAFDAIGKAEVVSGLRALAESGPALRVALCTTIHAYVCVHL